MQECSEENFQHLLDKVTPIDLSVLQTCISLDTGLKEISGGKGCLVIWEQYESVKPEEVDKILRTVSLTTSSSDPYPSWIVKACMI